MSYFKKYKHNYLFISAVLLYCTYLFFVFVAFSINEFSEYPIRYNSNTNFLSLIFSALIIAPVTEEFIFRGFATKNKILKIISIVGIPVFLLITKNYYVLIIATPYLVFLLFNFFKKNLVNKHILFVYSAIIFALAHYKLIHFENLITVIPILTQLGMGLLLVWIIINFDIKKAIFTHFTINLLLLTPVFFSLQFPDLEVKTLNHKNYQITWEKTPIMSNMKTISRPNPYEVIVNSSTPLDVYLSYDIENKSKLRNSEIFYKYDLSIKKLNNEAVKLDSIAIKNILLKAKLLIDD